CRPVPLEDLADDVIDLVSGQLGIHRQADAARRGSLSVRNRSDDPRLLTPRIPLLLMNGDGVVGLGIDPVLDEEIDQFIAARRVLRLDHVEMEDVTVAGLHVRQVDVRRLAQTGGVELRPLDPIVVPLVDVLQLGAENSGVDVVETAVEAKAVNVALARSVVAQLADLRVNLRIVGDQRAAVAERPEVLLNDEADRSSVAELTDPEAIA